VQELKKSRICGNSKNKLFPLFLEKKKKFFLFVNKKNLKSQSSQHGSGGANGTRPATAGVASPGHSTSGTGGRFRVDMRFDASPGS
jgi:hypothetical protein